ncbi:hypothetical protein [Paracoccus marcusii]|uniref:Uncharacterized protein n=1 Tax=Paracoccus marcusii TaxID=59779 RepID=A0ABY7UQA1_9RHOB|nr:hypothetical protein [Paracoccus marcusii]WDA11591.1 hypothetical protein PRL19_09780 [Paracoccus marcusii]
MAGLVTTLSAEWPVIAGAPWSFVGSVAVVAVVVWGVLQWAYTTRMANLNSSLSTRDDRIDDLTGKLVDRDHRIAELTTKLADALATPKKAQPLDPDEIQQSDRIVGKLQAHEVRRSEGIVVAKKLVANGDYNQTLPFAFRDMTLVLVDFGSSGSMSGFGETKREFGKVICRIIN